jgi:predicted branched-subunit amino acid permease
VRAVGNPVVHGGQVGQVKHFAHQGLALSAQAAFHVLVVGERKVDRNRLVAGAHLQADTVVL